MNVSGSNQALLNSANKRRVALVMAGCSTYKMYVVPDKIMCLCCGFVSFNVHDIANKYCAFCHAYHSDELDKSVGINIAELVEGLTERCKTLEAERDAAVKETNNLRDGLTRAMKMPWAEMPQPSGGMATRCPDDQEIIATIEYLWGQLYGSDDE